MRALAALLGLGAGLAVGAMALRPEAVQHDVDLPVVEQEAPGPDDPPVVWITADVEEVTAREVLVREGEGPQIRLGRFAAGATRFLRLEGDEWVRAGSTPGAGTPVCVEALLDDGRFLALRVFLEATCSPVP
ncbi:MAG TPA: hypothetical protein VGB51_06050 [Actinomycetota bacterium]